MGYMCVLFFQAPVAAAGGFQPVELANDAAVRPADSLQTAQPEKVKQI
jgi:hypothetical protein